MKVKCDHCQKEFNRRPVRVEDNKNKGHKLYCSLECSHASRKNKQIYYCKHCNKEIHKTPYEARKSKSGNVFCSKSCAASFNNTITKAGSNNPSWKDGVSSYSRIAFKLYVAKCTICDFNIKSALTVHHIDENSKNANSDNLIILCANCHFQVHYGDLVISEEIKQKREQNKIINS